MDVMKDATIDYVKTRKQFGRSIGSFQVIQHRLVDLLMEIEQTRSATMLAAAHLFSPPDIRDKHISAAKNLAGRIGSLLPRKPFSYMAVSPCAGRPISLIMPNASQ